MTLTCNELKTSTQIEYVCKLIFETFKLPVFFINKEERIECMYTYEYLQHPLYKDTTDYMKELLPFPISSTIPTIHSTKYGENFFCVNVIENTCYRGTFVVGPSLFSHIDANSLDILLNKHRISISYKRPLLLYFNEMEVVSHTRLISMAVFVYYAIYNEKLDALTVVNENSSLQHTEKNVEKYVSHHLSTNRKNTSLHHSQMREEMLMQCVKSGDVKKLLDHIDKPLDGEVGILSKSTLRSERNLAICLTTITTRAAIEGGLNTELAYTLSDSYIQLIEETNALIDLYALNNTILIDFTKRVHKAREGTHTKHIKQCQNYIFKHLYEEISLPALSNVVNLNANYLSTLFKKEVGMSISEYIHKERIEESKNLLISTSHSILDISTLLKFHDQSHFTRVFTRYTKISPKKYRDAHWKL